jgi:hypothetical protein
MKVHPGQRLKAQIQQELGHLVFTPHGYNNMWIDLEEPVEFSTLSKLHLIVRAHPYAMYIRGTHDDAFIVVQLELQA